MRKHVLYGRRYDVRSVMVSSNPASKPMTRINYNICPILQLSKLRLRKITQFTQGRVVEMVFQSKSADPRAGILYHPPPPLIEKGSIATITSVMSTRSSLSANCPLQVLEKKEVGRKHICHLRAWLGGSFSGDTNELPLRKLIPLPPHPRIGWLLY